MYKNWPELNQPKRAPVIGKWAKDLMLVNRKKKTVMANPVLRGRCLLLHSSDKDTESHGEVQALPQMATSLES